MLQLRMEPSIASELDVGLSLTEVRTLRPQCWQRCVTASVIEARLFFSNTTKACYSVSGLTTVQCSVH